VITYECVQQDDPLGPLLFCVSNMKLARNMTSELNLWYFDDGSIGGELRDLLHDLDTARRVGPTLGLLFNENKCEIVKNDDGLVNSFRAVIPNIQHIPCNDALLLSATIGDESSN
jgi:hypothetical protein